MKRRLQSAVFALSLLPAAYAASGTDLLVPHFIAGQTYSNAFSIMHSIQAQGYDEHAGRNGGSADYHVLAADPGGWRLSSAWRYDGKPGGVDEIEIRDGGRTQCVLTADQPAKCQPYLDGSGLVYNPALWGSPPRRLAPGMSWKVTLPQAWELGGANGTQQVTVVSVDDAMGAVVLRREGAAQGLFGEGESAQRQLTHDGQTETFDVTPGTAHWKGYATIVKGVIFSDVLLVTRDDALHGKDGSSVHATERWIMLLNAVPSPSV